MEPKILSVSEVIKHPLLIIGECDDWFFSGYWKRSYFNVCSPLPKAPCDRVCITFPGARGPLKATWVRVVEIVSLNDSPHQMGEKIFLGPAPILRTLLTQSHAKSRLNTFLNFRYSGVYFKVSEVGVSQNYVYWFFSQHGQHDPKLHLQCACLFRGKSPKDISSSNVNRATGILAKLISLGWKLHVIWGVTSPKWLEGEFAQFGISWFIWISRYCFYFGTVKSTKDPGHSGDILTR